MLVPSPGRISCTSEFEVLSLTVEELGLVTISEESGVTPDNAESKKISTVLDLLWKWVVRPVLTALEYVCTDEPISKMFEMV